MGVEVQETQAFEDTKQVWTIIRNPDDVDMDLIRLEIFDPDNDDLIVDINWKAKDFFKKMVDLQYDYAR